jgi:succinate dehydrogenase / fumarate reductase membrane anchor subunit
MTDPLARARGLGSAKQGVHHWSVQRATAVLLLFLIPWLTYSLVSVAGASHAEIVGFIANPINACLLIFSLVVLLYHGALGMQVVIEDYVHNRSLEITLLLLVRALAAVGIILGTIYVLKLALGA